MDFGGPGNRSNGEAGASPCVLFSKHSAFPLIFQAAGDFFVRRGNNGLEKAGRAKTGMKREDRKKGGQGGRRTDKEPKRLRKEGGDSGEEAGKKGEEQKRAEKSRKEREKGRPRENSRGL